MHARSLMLPTVVALSTALAFACLASAAEPAAKPAFPAARAGSAAAASRPAEKGCDWKPFSSAALGVTLLVQECRDPYSRYVFSAKGNRLEQHRPADDRTFGGPLVLEMFTKPADQSIEQAIAAQFIAKLPPDARKSCRVEAVKRREFSRGKLAFTLVPTGQYARKIYAELAQYPRDFGCGPYGKRQGDTYFEYHPNQVRTRFAFVDYGMDAPLFDEASLQFFPPAVTRKR